MGSELATPSVSGCAQATAGLQMPRPCLLAFHRLFPNGKTSVKFTIEGREVEEVAGSGTRHLTQGHAYSRSAFPLLCRDLAGARGSTRREPGAGVTGWHLAGEVGSLRCSSWDLFPRGDKQSWLPAGLELSTSQPGHTWLNRRLGHQR